ncbi:calcium-binding protein [Belnapia sp. F-4-1]|uniref:calcium-binding protein n=1 Tax=Belnapia sp. F-4-1 TaxID=1545443 RepID=UPI00068E14A5|nr:calcium-binding protein [Belnapia sp. F-4-1]
MRASASFALPGEVERLTLLPKTGNSIGIGNALANTVTGNEGENLLIGAGGDNTIRGDAGKDALQGADGNDSLDGGDGNDSLEGGADADVLVGGAGDDTYVVDTAADRVMEAPGGGRDVMLVAIPGGGAGADILVGNVGATWLRSGAGDDTLDGAGPTTCCSVRRGRVCSGLAPAAAAT